MDDALPITRFFCVAFVALWFPLLASYLFVLIPYFRSFDPTKSVAVTFWYNGIIGDWFAVLKLASAQNESVPPGVYAHGVIFFAAWGSLFIGFVIQIFHDFILR